MDMVTLLLIALGLAMDAFAVSVAQGMGSKDLRSSNALKLAFSFGSFQAFMPVAGWLMGLRLLSLISGVDHWVAFVLLGFIGCKMIYESFRLESNQNVRPLSLRVLLILSIATSIDALAVGLSFAFLAVSITTPTIVIGTVTFLLSLIGVFFGSRIGHIFENKIEIAGGLVLIVIGLKILIEHLI